MKENLYEVSDGLFQLRRLLADFEDSGVTMDGATTREWRNRLKELALAAKKKENEISRHRWNLAARKDQELAAAVAIEATRPGTNLLLLAPVARMAFSDGHPHSGGMA